MDFWVFFFTLIFGDMNISKNLVLIGIQHQDCEQITSCLLKLE